MMDMAAAYLLALGKHPATIALLIFAMTFVLEDVATAGAAILAAEGTLSPTLALAALFFGIFTSDIVLYAIGSAARTQEWARNFIGEDRMERGRHWLERRYFRAIVVARFVPGLRIPTFTASGFLSLPFVPFVLIVALAGFAWSTLVFTLVYLFGTMFLDSLGPVKWALVVVLLVAVFIAPGIIDRLISRRENRHD